MTIKGMADTLISTLAGMGLEIFRTVGSNIYETVSTVRNDHSTLVTTLMTTRPANEALAGQQALSVTLEEDMRESLFMATAMAVAIGAAAPGAVQAASTNNQLFSMIVSPGAVGCLPGASGRVSLVETVGGQRLHVEVFHMPKNLNFNFFTIQVPNAPFGLGWYQGEILTDDNGSGVGDFAGVFSRETFIVAPGKAVAPVIFPTDVNTNPTTAPVHTHHLGLWFDSPADATKVGCPGAKTPFNGTHDAGIQALNTANFPDLAGPLQKIQ